MGSTCLASNATVTRELQVELSTIDKQRDYRLQLEEQQSNINFLISFLFERSSRQDPHFTFPETMLLTKVSDGSPDPGSAVGCRRGITSF